MREHKGDSKGERREDGGSLKDVFQGLFDICRTTYKSGCSTVARRVIKYIYNSSESSAEFSPLSTFIPCSRRSSHVSFDSSVFFG